LSDPPRIEDLDGLFLDNRDLEDLRRCRPGKCGVKLSVLEMTQLRSAAANAADWKDAVQQAFRAIVLQRATDYLARGDRDAPAYYDDPAPVAPYATFLELGESMPLLAQRFPGLCAYLREYPNAHDPHVVRSFLYWAKEMLGGRPIISVTHAAIARYQQPSLPEAVVVSRQVYATHYKNGAVTITAISESATGRHLLYLHRSSLDMIGGIFGGIARRTIERRLRAEGPRVLMEFRSRLERAIPLISPSAK